METPEISQLLRQTLIHDANSVKSATDALARLSTTPYFPFSLLHIASDDEDQGVRIAAATFLKNLTRKNIDTSNSSSTVSKEFKDTLVSALLRSESAVLKVLIEAFRGVVAVEFVKNNSWPELVPELKMVIQGSDRINPRGNSEWKTVNALTVLHSVIRPFQYFMNPKLAKEPVPSQLELISQEILVPLLAFFHHCVDKVSTSQGQEDLEIEKILLILAKCIYFSVRSHMPLALVPLLHSLCHDLTRLLNCLCFDGDATHEDKQSQMFKAGKRSLLIFCTFVTRHRKFTDKLMADITNSALKLVPNTTLLSKLGFLSERVISLAFDLISRVLETGPGWRLVSPHFSTLLDNAIFPALMMNEKDMEEWEEDADEYIRKNLPTELEEISGWREDLFTARKSALNLLGVISISKGPPVVASFSSKRKKGETNRRKDRSSMGELLVLPFLAKFSLPSDATNMKSVSEYYGVLMAYSSLLDFLMEQKPGFISTLLQTRVLPLYKDSNCQPYLVASANWVLGELSTCLPEDMSVDIYSSLMKALGMPDVGDASCYPVRISAAGAISQLVENEYMPPEWLPVLKAVVGRISDDEEEETCINLQLLSTLVEAANEGIAPHITHIIPLLARAISKCLADYPEAWPQMVERGFATLAVMAQCWEQFVNEETEQDDSPDMWIKGQADISGSFSGLLQLAWLSSEQSMDGGSSPSELPARCLDDLSWLLWFILRCVSGNDIVETMLLSDLLQVWSDIIADWHDWEEMEDISIFKCIKEAVFLNKKFTIKNFIMGGASTSSTSRVPRKSIVEGMAAFITNAFQQYPSAVRRASSTVHVLLHVTSYSNEGEHIKQALVAAFSRSAFSRFREIKSKPCPLWKSFLFTLSSCFLSNPETVESTLEEIESQGFTIFLSALAFISSDKSEQPLSTESEIKLTVLALARAVEQLIKPGRQSAHLLLDCFTSMMEASMRLKELQEEDEEEGEENTDEDDIEDEDTEDDEDSEDDEREETEEEFLERCAKAAAELDNDTIEEGDDEDEEYEIELGDLEDLVVQNIMLSLLERHRALLQGQLPSELITRFLQSFPEYHRLF